MVSPLVPQLVTWAVHTLGQRYLDPPALEATNHLRLILLNSIVQASDLLRNVKDLQDLPPVDVVLEH